MGGHVYEFPPLDDSADTAVVVERIDAAGIVGMGGAGYPTAKKVEQAIAAGADFVIGNGMANEPGVEADRTLLREHFAQVVAGLRIVARCLGGAEAAVAVPPGSSLPSPAVAIEVGYPSGDERDLVARLTGRRVPANGYPTDVRTLVLNVATLFAVFEAVMLGRALRRRLVSFAGTSAWVAIGTPLADLPIETYGRELRTGGALTGRPAPPDALVEATTYSVGAAPPPALTCIGCGRCDIACPEGLSPERLHAAFETGALNETATACIECGACTEQCPSGIDLVNEFRAIKRRIRHDATLKQRTEAARRRSTARTERLARQARQRQAHREQRLRTPRQW